MKKLFLLVIIVFLPYLIFSQPRKVQTSWDALFSVGYGDVVTNDISDYYNSLAEGIKYYGVPIETQTKFGRTLITNAEIIYAVEDMRVGISLGYLYSPAYSNYKDINGTLKLNGSVNTFDFGLKVRYIPDSIGNFPIIIDGQAGICHTSLNINEEIRFTDYPQFNYDWKMSKGGWGPSLQALIGTSIDIGSFTISLEGGYKYSITNVMEQKEESTSKTETVNKEMNIGPSGFIFLISFGIKL